MAKKEVSLKATMDTRQVLSYLEDLIASIKAGTVVIQQGSEFVTLKPGKVLDLDVDASQKKGKERVTLEISWKKDDETAEALSFKISSSEPVIEVDAQA